MAKATATDIINELGYRDVGFSENPDFDEVELRLQTAQYYQLFLKQELFDDESLAAQTVQEEFREFARLRLKVYLGLEAARVNVIERDPVFSADEIVALKQLAHRLLEASEDLGKGAESPQYEPEDEIMVVAPPAPKVAPRAKPAPVKAPAAKLPPPKPVPAASKRPALRKMRGLEEPSAAPSTKSPVAAKPGPKKKADVNGIEELGVNPKSGARIVRQNGRVLEEAINPEDGTVMTNEQDMVIWKDITPQARPPPGSNFIPMPMPNQMAQLGMQEALEVQNRMSNSPLGNAVDEILRS